MAKVKTLTSDDIRKIRVIGGKKGTKRIGKPRYCVFHPKERRVIGILVKRPDLLWMFHRKDIFVGLDDFSIKDGHIVIHTDATTSGPAACKAMGIKWDDCVLWEGMPLTTSDGTAVGYVGNVTFERRSGEVIQVTVDNGVTSKYLLGTLDVPADLILGFKRGVGEAMAVDATGAEGEETFMGAIMVSDDVWGLEPEGGWAEAAGEYTAKWAKSLKETTEAVKPKVKKATKAAGKAVNDGAFALGKQIGSTKGMFSSFKEEYQKAKK